jgi:hypothetical protein
MKAKVLFLVMAVVVTIGVSAKKPAEPSVAPTAVVNNTISGVVVDKATGEALTGVEIRVEGTELKTYTDFDGKFVFEGILSGEYKINASMISYRENETRLIKVKTNELHALNLNLESVID